ncbi:unnamed protein product [Paramecium primaurelia]|uniref:Protein-S-isoprenylcysteine O-methyltransferase n=1 Tax=Paramecium primaurelia TaxID=5886 RepID=A0A8S1LET8_PARPR|nr:unnamed protein product [Paramecium primaurelia]
MLINKELYLIQWIIIALTLSLLLLFDTVLIQISIIGSLIYFTWKLSPKRYPKLGIEISKINATCVVFGFLIYFAWIIRENHVGFSIFLMNQVLFHMGEMLHVAFYKFNLLKWGSYLINHSFGYNLAISFSISEYFAESYFFNKNYQTLILIGVLCTLVGHIFRIGAFISAKQSFHHQVQSKKASDHILITTGIYKFSRHPSYFGFFIYSLGQQIILQNPISFIAYIPVLYKFFIQRIYLEEYYLYQFFGHAYQDYSENTPILIPFIEYFLRF